MATERLSEADMPGTPAGEINLADIRKWLTDYLAYLVGEPADSIDAARSFDRYGIDSAAAVSLVGDLEQWMGLELDPTIVYDYPNIDQLSDYLVTQQSGSAAQ